MVVGERGRVSELVLNGIFVLAAGIASGMLLQYGVQVTEPVLRYSLLGLAGVFVLGTVVSLYWWTLAVQPAGADTRTAKD